jgi:hypothetical protein
VFVCTLTREFVMVFVMVSDADAVCTLPVNIAAIAEIAANAVNVL